MKTILGAFRFAMAMLFTLACILMVLVYLQWVTPEKKVGFLRTWCRALLRIVGIDLKIDGKVYDEHCLIVANHVSFMDIFGLNVVKPGRFIAKSEIADWPIFGQIAKGVDTLFIERKNRRSILTVNQQISDALSKKQTIMLFPEGRTSAGSTLLPLRSNLMEPAVMSQTPIQPIVLLYRDHGMPTTKASYTDISLFGCLWNIVTSDGLSLTVKVLPLIDPKGKDRREVAAEASALMSKAMGVADPMQAMNLLN
ncbi:MAG: 1-acyl-sn-glycerol-3-phosphate acyltransferase [Burkholderiaceae bacterium]|nr:1-acyl-sn-glycerol-3-phosphate acyltransferase [Burkholderiaceae bacterium]